MPSPKIKNYSITSPGPYIPQKIFAISSLSAPPFCSLLTWKTVKEEIGELVIHVRNFHFWFGSHTAFFSLKNHHHHKTKLSNSLIQAHHWICLGGQKGYEHVLPFWVWKKLGPSSHYLILPPLPPPLPPPLVAGPYVISLNIPSGRAPPPPALPPLYNSRVAAK